MSYALLAGVVWFTLATLVVVAYNVAKRVVAGH